MPNSNRITDPHLAVIIIISLHFLNIIALSKILTILNLYYII